MAVSAPRCLPPSPLAHPAPSLLLFRWLWPLFCSAYAHVVCHLRGVNSRFSLHASRDRFPSERTAIRGARPTDFCDRCVVSSLSSQCPTVFHHRARPPAARDSHAGSSDSHFCGTLLGQALPALLCCTGLGGLEVSACYEGAVSVMHRSCLISVSTLAVSHAVCRTRRRAAAKERVKELSASLVPTSASDASARSL